MGILRFASADTKRIELGEGDWIEVQSDISKRDFNTIVALMPADVDEEKGFTPPQATEFQTALFAGLVKGWSLSEPATTDNYLKLSREAASTIDNELVKVFQTMTVGEPEAKKPETSRRSSRVVQPQSEN